MNKRKIASQRVRIPYYSTKIGDVFPQKNVQKRKPDSMQKPLAWKGHTRITRESVLNIVLQIQKKRSSSRKIFQRVKNVTIVLKSVQDRL